MSRYLVDTSVWIDFFRKRKTPAVEKFYSLLDTPDCYGITELIYQEILPKKSVKLLPLGGGCKDALDLFCLFIYCSLRWVRCCCVSPAIRFTLRWREVRRFSESSPSGMKGCTKESPCFSWGRMSKGALHEQDFQNLADYLSSQPFFYPKHGVETYRQAAHLYFSCRRQGITIRSTIDCLIAQIAIEHDLILLHSDKDFLHITNVVSQLKLYSA